LERLSPGATFLCVLAANSPDADIVVLAFGDRWDFLQHHRGITHAIVGTAFLALLLPLIFAGVDRLWARLRHHSPQTKFRGLLIASLIASATHPVLDWTNNYGIRFLLPWNPRWFYGDLVFIVDPFLWVVLGGAAFLLASRSKISKFVWATLAALITLLIVFSARGGDLPNRTLFGGFWAAAVVVIIGLCVMGARERWGPKIAYVAFAVVLVYWCVLAWAHSFALERSWEEANRLVAPNGESVARLAAMPTLANPLRWDCVFETDQATYRFPVALNGQTPAGNVIRYPKPSGKLAAALEAAARQKPAHVFLGFARFPVARLRDADCTTQTLLQLADLRYTEPGTPRGTFAVDLPVDCSDYIWESRGADE
jgi:inner membrane protein